VKITGTMINDYFYCKRRLWLRFNEIHIGNEFTEIRKELHEEKENKNSLVLFDCIKLDDFDDEYIIEYKKTKKGKISSHFQLYYYLYLLKQNGLERKGKIIYLEEDEYEVFILDTNIEQKILEVIREIEEICDSSISPKQKRGCGNCAYANYCKV